MEFILVAGACSTWPAWCSLSSKARAAAIKSVNVIFCRRARLRRFCEFPAKITWLAIFFSTSVKLQYRASCRTVPAAGPCQLPDRASCWTAPAAGPRQLQDRASCRTVPAAGPCQLQDRASCRTVPAAGPCQLQDRASYRTVSAAGPCQLPDRASCRTVPAAGPCQLPEPCYVCIILLPVLLSALSEIIHFKCGVCSWSEMRNIL